jgi:membrane-bound lytic murein transglycosylase D
MHPLKTRSVLLTASLLLGTQLTSHSADLSLPYHNWSQVSASRSPYDPNDPLVQLLSMDEIDVWGRIRDGFDIADLDNPLVTRHTQWYSAHPDYFLRTTTRASRYLFHVVQELEKRGMPTELALLPFIESAFNPQAMSRAKAAGMWQFIPSTGLAYDLKQGMFTDERRNVIASTDAALTYLEKLYGMFGDWQLALAAYNWGEGSVRRAIKRAERAGVKPDFNGLSRYMPAETRNYVPKLQAVKNIIAAPDQYSVTLPKVDNAPYFVIVEKTRDIDVEIAAQLAELPIEEFEALNPQFNRPLIPGGPDTQILLPQENAGKFKANLAKWEGSLSSWTAHKVTEARARIENIAKKFDTTAEIIREVNDIPPKMLLAAGSIILVPKTDKAADRNIAAEWIDTAKMIVIPDVPAGRRVSVKVGRGDTLSAIARRYRVSVAQIKKWNGLQHDRIFAGHTLQLNVLGQKAKSGTRNVAKKAPARKKARTKSKKKNSG